MPDPPARDGDGLARALRAAGVESAVADHVKRLRDRLRASRYGPRGLGDAAELAAELEQVLRVLGAEPGGKARRVVAAVALVAVDGGGATVPPAPGGGVEVCRTIASRTAAGMTGAPVTWSQR